MTLERVSIELSQRCGKACWFCYSESSQRGGESFTPADVVAFVRDLAANGVRAVSFGGGEPLEYAGVHNILRELRGVLFRSLTTNGLPLLRPGAWDALLAAAPDKVHVSIHFPERAGEVTRVIEQVTALGAAGIRSGVNLLVARSNLAAATSAAQALDAAGIGPERIVLLPMRGQDTPSPGEIAGVVAGRRFQSMTCLGGCAKSPRFCAVAWNRTVAWCSYTTERRPLERLTYRELVTVLDGLGVTYCGGDEREDLVRLSRRAQHGHDVVRGRP